jgi:CheY-like chemotaxis protein
MTRKVWRVLIIDDDAALAQDAERELRDGFASDPDVEIQVEYETNFDIGLTKFRQGEGDIVVLDVRRGAPNGSAADKVAGREVFQEIKKGRFAPVIFWTALPLEVQDEIMLPLVAIIQKDDLAKLPEAVKAAIRSGAVDTISKIVNEVESQLQDYMWTELGPHWAEYAVGTESNTTWLVLITRLARRLELESAGAFTGQPSHRYIYPPIINSSRAPGDVVHDLTSDNWWVVLTPACDLEQAKAELVLLAEAIPLASHPKYLRWIEAKQQGSGKDKWSELSKDVLTSTRGRYYYLPAFRDLPDLVVDLEKVRTLTSEELGSMTAVASLVSPFSEALLVQNSHFRGRIGVPDIDSDVIRQRLEVALAPEE